MAETDNSALPANIDLLFLGGLQSDYGILPDRRTFEQSPGGAVAYALVGTMVWIQSGLGLVSRVTRQFPAQWVSTLADWGVQTDGVVPSASDSPMIGFHCYRSWDERIVADPNQAYGRLNLPCPPILVKMQCISSVHEEAELDPDLLPRPEDIPAGQRQARFAYLAPMRCETQIRLTTSLRQNGTGHILVSVASREMTPEHFGKVRLLLHGQELCFCTEESVRHLFDRPIGEIEDLAERLASLGPQVILIGRKRDGYAIYDSFARRHLSIPAYASTFQNPIGIGHAFCGGFLAGWKESFDLLEAGLRGSVSASFAANGLGAFHALECNPMLAGMRLEALRRLMAK
jgi:sugar/nucleoside kinase (ribokinase family)